jgi:hypothetical protein
VPAAVILADPPPGHSKRSKDIMPNLPMLAALGAALEG